jgi:hypothetical protein
MGNGLFAGDPLVGFSRRPLMIPSLTSVSRTVGVSKGYPRLDGGRVLEANRRGLQVRRAGSQEGQCRDHCGASITTFGRNLGHSTCAISRSMPTETTPAQSVIASDVDACGG